MGYTPFKMLGHEHPGIKQRETPATLKAFGVDDSDGVDKISTTPNKMAAVGSSPAKGFWDSVKRVGAGVLTGGLSEVARARKKKKEEAAAAAAATAEPVEGGGEPTVPPHGDEAHTGGAIGGGEGGEAPWEAMDRSKFMAMDKSARKDYMGGLDQDQRKEQMSSMFSGFGGVGGIKKGLI